MRSDLAICPAIDFQNGTAVKEWQAGEFSPLNTFINPNSPNSPVRF